MHIFLKCSKVALTYNNNTPITTYVPKKEENILIHKPSGFTGDRNKVVIEDKDGGGGGERGGNQKIFHKWACRTAS